MTSESRIQAKVTYLANRIIDEKDPAKRKKLMPEWRRWHSALDAIRQGKKSQEGKT